LDVEGNRGMPDPFTFHRSSRGGPTSQEKEKDTNLKGESVSRIVDRGEKKGKIHPTLSGKGKKRGGGDPRRREKKIPLLTLT